MQRKREIGSALGCNFQVLAVKVLFIRKYNFVMSDKMVSLVGLVVSAPVYHAGNPLLDSRVGPISEM